MAVTHIDAYASIKQKKSTTHQRHQEAFHMHSRTTRQITIIFLFLLIGDSTAAFAEGRRTIWSYFSRSEPTEEAYAAEEEENSAFTVGSLLGLGIATYDVTQYKVRNDIVVVDREDSIGGRLSPAAYILPSVIIAKPAGRPLAAILPAAVTGASSRDVAAGIGLSYGFNASEAAEVGLALAVVFAPFPSLSAAQKQSLDTKQPLPSGESSTIEDSREINLVIGFYIAPKL